jgi:phosphohistidine phosphatase
MINSDVDSKSDKRRIRNFRLMKTLWLIRHAKSSWNLPELHDSLRPLNERGYRDAHEMASRLNKSDAKPDLIISSFAVRAYSTAVIFARELGYDTGKILLTDRLYETSAQEYFKFVIGLPESAGNVAVFGHNPSISLAVNLLSDTEAFDMPTCCIAELKFKVTRWDQCDTTSGKLEMLDYPKNISQG